MFKLLRYFSLASLASIMVAVLLLGTLYRHIALDNLLEMDERNNVALSNSLANSLRAEILPLLDGDAGGTDSAKKAQTLSHLNARVVEYTRGTSVVKVKIYDLRGKTVFSSEAKQIGQEKWGNLGFQAALAGQPASELTHRDKFSAFEQVIEDRDVLSSYVPIWRDEKVYAVFEVYDDVTPLLAQLATMQAKIIASVVLVLAGLYGVLFVIVRRADRILHEQHLAKKNTEERIRQLNLSLEQRVLERTTELQTANQEMEAFSYSVSHDLRAPLRSIDGFSQALLEDYADKLDDQGRNYLNRVRTATQRMGHLIDDMHTLARMSRSPILRETVDLSALATEVLAELQESEPERKVDWQIESGLVAEGDANLLRVVLVNLLGNAWKFSGKTANAQIEFGALNNAPLPNTPLPNTGAAPGLLSTPAFFVRDNGAGFDMAYADKLFGVFQRMHLASDFAGTGIGLATVQRVIHSHGGRVWAEAALGKGATFYFTL